MSSSVVRIDCQQKALIKEAQSTYIHHKRPAVVLEEDEYINGLSQVIKRDFFPGLKEEVEAESWSENGYRQFSDWSRASALTPRRDSCASSAQTPAIPGRTDTTVETRKLNQPGKVKVDTSVSLGQYQAKYTSEDNADFLDILDKQNLFRREKYSWHYNNNKIYSENTERHQKRLEQKHEKESENAVSYIDDRKSAAGWKVKPKNALMFLPDAPEEQDSTVTSTIQSREKTTISLSATRLSQDALNHDSTTTTTNHAQAPEDEPEEPRVNGYGFIEEPDTPLPQLPRNPFPESPKPTEQKPNPFRITDTPARDQLHDRLLLKARRTSTPKAPNTTLRKTLATPKFKSSPMLSPAAHRMLGQSSSLRDRLKTPLTKSHLR